MRDAAEDVRKVPIINVVDELTQRLRSPSLDDVCETDAPYKESGFCQWVNGMTPSSGKLPRLSK